jgi:hypothetical protein
VATTFQAQVGGERNAFGLPADVPLTATVDLKHFRRVGGQIALACVSTVRQNTGPSSKD